MRETANETESESPFQSLLYAAFHIQRLIKECDELSNHDDVMRAANNDN